MKTLVPTLAVIWLSASLPAPAHASGVPTQIVIDAPTLIANQGEPIQLAAIMRDDGGAEITGYTFDWSATQGSVTQGGLFTPRSPGVAHVTATSSGVSATIDINIAIGLSAHIAIAPSFGIMQPIAGVVTVKTIDGRPLRGADVVVNVRNEALGPAAGTLPEEIRGRTAADGTFAFHPSSLLSTVVPTEYKVVALTIWHGNYASAESAYTIAPPAPLPTIPSP